MSTYLLLVLVAPLSEETNKHYSYLQSNYMLISKNYQENRFKDTEIADNLRNKISDIIDRNTELNN